MLSFTDVIATLAWLTLVVGIAELRSQRIDRGRSVPVRSGWKLRRRVDRAPEAPVVAEPAIEASKHPPIRFPRSDEEAFEMEQEIHDTEGAGSGYQVSPFWVAQDERDAFEEECSKDSSLL